MTYRGEDVVPDGTNERIEGHEQHDEWQESPKPVISNQRYSQPTILII